MDEVSNLVEHSQSSSDALNKSDRDSSVTNPNHLLHMTKKEEIMVDQPLLATFLKKKFSRLVQSSIEDRLRKLQQSSETQVQSTVVRQKFWCMMRLKDIACLITSYPPLSYVAAKEYEWWIEDVMRTNHYLKDIEAISAKKRKYTSLEEELEARIQKCGRGLCEDPFLNIEVYFSPAVEEMYTRLQLVMRQEKLTNLPLGVGATLPLEQLMPLTTLMMHNIPQEMFDSAIDSAARQILQSLENQLFYSIGISGRDGKEVMRKLKDLPQIREMFDVVVWITVSDGQTDADIQEAITQQLDLSASRLNSQNFLLLAADVGKKIDLYGSGMLGMERFKTQKVVFTTGSSRVCQVMGVDLEIRTEDHLLPWELFCRNVGQVIQSPTIQPIAVQIVQKCGGHLLAIILMARALKELTSHVVWQTALVELGSTFLNFVEEEGVNEVMVNALRFIWRRKEYLTQQCIRHCALHTNSPWISKSLLIHIWIMEGPLGPLHTHEEGKIILEDLINSFLVVSSKSVNIVSMPLYIRYGLVKFFEAAQLIEQGEKRLIYLLENKGRNTQEPHVMDGNNIWDLPLTPRWSMLKTLSLQMLHDLKSFPPSFFNHVPLLELVDLSYTSIKFLPPSFFTLIRLQGLFLRGCELFMELPPQIGELVNLQVLDLERTEIISLPIDMKKLINLRCFKVAFYAYMNRSKRSDWSKTMIPMGIVSQLSQLNELNMYVNPDDERWYSVVEDVVKELSSLKHLKALKVFLPEVKLLGASAIKELASLSSTQFRFIVGPHLRRIMSLVPDEVLLQFEQWNKSLRYVNGKSIPTEVMDLLQHTTAFFLDRHMNVTSLSEFGANALNNLKCLILEECNKMQTIVDGRKFYEDGHDEKENVFGSVQYLRVHYMKSLESIWIGSIRKGCLCNLKSLALHTCPQLVIIFTLGLLRNLNLLEELVIEDCPAIKSLVGSHESRRIMSVPIDFLPNLRKLSLLYLPELVCISNGLRIARKLELMSFYDCPKLKSLSNKEVSSKQIRVIRAESEWWDALVWDESEWESGRRPGYLDHTFVAINGDMDLFTQLAADKLSSTFEASENLQIRRNDKRRVPNQNEKRTVRIHGPIPPDDGYTWRKYGEKNILGSGYPRSYYRCTHSKVYMCLAKKQVQQLDNDPSTAEVTYSGVHTCTMAPSIPSVSVLGSTLLPEYDFEGIFTDDQLRDDEN